MDRIKAQVQRGLVLFVASGGRITKDNRLSAKHL